MQGGGKKEWLQFALDGKLANQGRSDIQVFGAGCRLVAQGKGGRSLHIVGECTEFDLTVSFQRYQF